MKHGYIVFFLFTVSLYTINVISLKFKQRCLTIITFLNKFGEEGKHLLFCWQTVFELREQYEKNSQAKTDTSKYWFEYHILVLSSFR